MAVLTRQNPAKGMPQADMMFGLDQISQFVAELEYRNRINMLAPSHLVVKEWNLMIF